jgi:hypothetical protein
MEHLTDKQLLELLEQLGDQSDVLDGSRRDHLDQCDRCMQRWLDLQESWDTLGAWMVDMPKIDLTHRIMSQVVSTSTIHLRQPRVWLRIAASVIIGVGVGALMGRTGPKPVSAEQASQAIYLNTLALNSSTGWTAPLLSESQE